MAGVIKVDRVQSDSNLAFNIAGANVAFMDASALQMVGSNIAVGGTNVITSGKVVRTGMPVGSVLQVGHYRKTDAYSTSSATLTDVTDFLVTLTPTSLNSRFLVSCQLYVGSYWWSTGGGKWIVKMNGTEVLGSSTYGWVLQYGADSGNSAYETMHWLDSAVVTPNTLSPVTFQLQLASGNASYATYLNRSYNGTNLDGKSSLTVMEIAA